MDLKEVSGDFTNCFRKRKFLFIGTYHSTHPVYGSSNIDFFSEIEFALDLYSNYDKFLIAGDLNVEEHESPIRDFLHTFKAKNLVKESTCFKSLNNPSCIDLFLTNSCQSFMHTTAVCTGLSDFHKMIVTLLKITFPKCSPKIIKYRDFSKFSENKFHSDLERSFKINKIMDYTKFETIFLNAFDKHAPYKQKVIRANQKPYITRQLRRAIMHRSYLENKLMKYRTDDYLRAYKVQKNYCNRLYKKERKNFYSNLNTKDLLDNKKFWKITKPFFSNKGRTDASITLVEGDEIISDDAQIAEKFNTFFQHAVKNLEITENKFLLCDTDNISGIEKAIEKFNRHPSILSINEKVKTDSNFSFIKIGLNEIKSELKALNGKKNGTFMNIPAKQLKLAVKIVSEPLMQIWNVQIVENKDFPAELKLPDITPIHKKLESVLKENYRPVSVLPTISKIFERLMQKQMNNFIGQYLSPYLCGYRKGYNSQYALLSMIEKWKKSLDNRGLAGGILMDLSKAFDTIDHESLIAKLHAYGFNKSALELIHNYLTNRWHRTKINLSFSPWAELLSGVPPGSVLGPLLFNIYINDLFDLFINTDVCNLADDTTPYACDTDLSNLLHNLESDALSAIMWFEANYMKLNADKCHFLYSGYTFEHIYVNVSNEMIWESSHEKMQ